MAVPDITVPFFDRDGFGSVNIFHGPFWPVGPDLGPFQWEAWVRPRTGGEYWISEGFGGAHAILAGFGGGGTPTGNVYDGTGNTSFLGAYTAQSDEWLHYTVMWDGATIWLLINGIVCGKFPFAGPRRAQFGDLFIGGSDHSNFNGCIAQVRAWEGQVANSLPWLGYQFAVERYFSDRQSTNGVVSQFCVNYLNPVDSFPDISDGFAGRMHPGASRGQYNGFGFDVGPEVKPTRIIDPTAPFGNQKNVARTRTAPSPVSAPAGAKIWDSFGRADSIPAFTLEPSMGTTEAGSLGVKTWEFDTYKWYIFDGKAVCGAFSTFATVTNDSADMDVRVGRLLDAAKGIFHTSVAARVRSDRTSGWTVITYYEPGTGDTYLILQRPDTTQAASALATGSWTHLRILTSGTTITVYTDDGLGGWTQRLQVTGETANQAEVGAGLFGPYGIGTSAHFTDFEVR